MEEKEIMECVSAKNAMAGETHEIIAAELSFDLREKASEEVVEIDRELARVNTELERYASRADKEDYAFAVASGLISGVFDSLFIGKMTITEKDIAISHEQVNRYIQKYAEKRGLEGKHLRNTIAHLENAFPVLQDNVWSGLNISISAKDHHLADWAHHPTPFGLLSAIAVQFLRVGTFVNREGEWHLVPVETATEDLAFVYIPAVITGILNWLVYIGKEKQEEEEEDKIPDYIWKLAHLVASTPIIVEIIQCIDNWYGHLVSDMGGSKQTSGGGMGIPGVFISLLYEISSMPPFNSTDLPKIIDKLYKDDKFDLRHELPVYKLLGKQSIPVVFNELLVRLMFFLTRLSHEMTVHQSIQHVDWNAVIPFNNRTVDRMLAVSSMTFTVADTADAAVRAAIESGGNYVLFAGSFVTRFNYVGAGRAAVAVVKEIRNEQKEMQLIHEKRLLMEEKTGRVLKQLQEYKASLEELVSGYLAEDITALLEGFDYMNEGFASGDSDLVIKGNVVIQRVLGREPQFTNQAEFDDLMESDVPLQF